MRKFILLLPVIGLLSLAMGWNMSNVAVLGAAKPKAAGGGGGGGATTNFSDNFNRANTSPLDGGWATVSGENYFVLTSNQVLPLDDNNDSTMYYNSALANDQWSSAKLYSSGSGGGGQGIGVAVRVSDSADTYYRCVVDSSGAYEVGKKVAGTYTAIRSGSVTWSSGAIMKLQVVGTTLTFFYNGSQVGATMTDSSISSGYAGISYSSTATGSAADDWYAGTP